MTPELRSFIEGFASVMLSTVDTQGRPFASYAPYCFYEGSYYIYVSELARHTGNLLHAKRAALLFIEEEAQAATVFARKRVVLECRAEDVSRESVGFSSVMARFAERFDAALVERLVGMVDFHLIRLIPEGGEAVFGFGEAYTIADDGITLIPRQDRGHRKA